MRQRLIPVFAAIVVLWPAVAGAQQLVLLVRHAERADGGAGSANAMTAKPVDPPLSAAGEARAARLATMLRDAGITAIYSTEYKRTQQTVTPLAAKLGLKVTTVPATDTAGLTTRLKSEHANGIVLVVGHSNTLPNVIKALGGAAPTIADDEYDSLFVFVPATKTLSRIRY